MKERNGCGKVRFVAKCVVPNKSNNNTTTDRNDAKVEAGDAIVHLLVARWRETFKSFARRFGSIIMPGALLALAWRLFCRSTRSVSIDSTDSNQTASSLASPTFLPFVPNRKRSYPTMPEVSLIV